METENTRDDIWNWWEDYTDLNTVTGTDPNWANDLLDFDFELEFETVETEPTPEAIRKKQDEAYDRAMGIV